MSRRFLWPVTAALAVATCTAAFAQGDEARELSDLRERVAAARSAADAAPDDIGAAVVLADALSGQADWLKNAGNPGWVEVADAALDAAREAHELRPSDTSTLLAMARALAVRGSLKKALAYADEAIDIEPANAGAYMVKGDIHAAAAKAAADSKWKLGRITRNRVKRAAEDAVAAYEHVLVASKDSEAHAAALIRAGTVRLELLKDKEGADRAWRGAVRAAPNSDAAEEAKDLIGSIE